jgi:hypothetical protein
LLQDFTGCRQRTPPPNSARRESQGGAHAYEGNTMAYDWSGDITRKRNRLKLASAVLVCIAIMLCIPAVLAPFLL